MLWENSNIAGKVKADIIIYEVDERFAKFVFPDVTPQCVIISNITRDQPPRQGNFDLVLEEINEVKKACKGKLLKVIIETCLLSEEEKIKLCNSGCPPPIYGRKP